MVSSLDFATSIIASCVVFSILGKYSSVPNRRVGQKNMQVGKFLENIKHAGRNRRPGGKFSGKSITVQGGNFLANQQLSRLFLFLKLL